MTGAPVTALIRLQPMPNSESASFHGIVRRPPPGHEYLFESVDFGYNCDTEAAPYSIIPQAHPASSPTNQIAEFGPDSEVWGLIRWPSEKPTLVDVAWLAGLIEGDGCFSGRVTVRMKDREPLDRARAMFGGRVAGPYLVPAYAGLVRVFDWYAAGQRGRGIARTVYQYLSTRRKTQARELLQIVSREYEPEPVTAGWLTRYLIDFQDGSAVG